MSDFWYHEITGTDLEELARVLSSEPWVEDLEDGPTHSEIGNGSVFFCGRPWVEDDVREILKALSRERDGRLNYVVRDGSAFYASAMSYVAGCESWLDTNDVYFDTFDGAKVVSDAVSDVPGSFRSLVVYFIGLCGEIDLEMTHAEGRRLYGVVSLLGCADADRYGELVGTDLDDLMSALRGIDIRAGEGRCYLDNETVAGFIATVEARLMEREGKSTGHKPAKRRI